MTEVSKQEIFALEKQAGFNMRLLRPAARRVRVYVIREIIERGRETVVLLPKNLARTIECHVNTAREAIRELEEIEYIQVVRGGGRSGRPREVTLGWKTVEELRVVASRLREIRWTPPPPGKLIDHGKHAGNARGRHPGNDPGNPLGRADSQAPPDNPKDRQQVTRTVRKLSEYQTIRGSGNQKHQQKKYTAPPLRSRCLSVSAYFTEQIDGVSEGDCIRLLDLAAGLRLEQGFVQELVNTFSVHDLLPIISNVHERFFTDFGDPEKCIRNPGGLIRETLIRRASGSDMQPLEGKRSAYDKYELPYREAFEGAR